MTGQSTIQVLAEMTDEGLFERVAMAVLRIDDPHCVALAHPGVNAQGRTRKGPLDGIGFVPGAQPRHLVAVHHTTAAAKDLRNKWLHDPASVKPRRVAGRPTQPAGDLLKTVRIVCKERRRTPDLRATLNLTTTQEPDEELLRDVVAEGAVHQIEVVVWPRSRLAHVLDTTPSGQWYRRDLLGIEQEILSEDLLKELSKLSLQTFAPPDEARAWVVRRFDSVLRSARRPVSFVVGESGLGKSIACYRAIAEHVENGGYGLVLDHEVVARCISFEQALGEGLQQLHPALAAGQSPLAFCTNQRPLLVLVEDIQRSGQPERLAARIAAWGARADGGKSQFDGTWRLFCPIWPGVVTQMDEQTRKLAESMTVALELMSAAEGCQAISLRAELAGRPISPVKAGSISADLGHDPLLIALYDFEHEPDAHSVLSRFVESELGQAHWSGDDTSADFRAALIELAARLLRERRIEPSWKELSSWDLTAETRRRIARLAQRARLLRLTGPSNDLRLRFRHDRVREWLLVEAAVSMADDLPDAVIAEPFFAEVLGAVIVRRGAPSSLLGRAQTLNPLTLFHALRLCGQDSTSERARMVSAIEMWLAGFKHLERGNEHLAWETLAALAATDGPEVIPLVKRFPYRCRSEQLARLRNGDVTGGIDLCLHSEPRLIDPDRDRHIEHAKMRYGARLTGALDRLLRRNDLDDASRNGLLRFAGHIGSPELGASIEACWLIDPARRARLAEYLWAFARCAQPDTAARYLDPLCTLWAGFPDRPTEEHGTSARDAISADGLTGAFTHHPPWGALEYFIHRAQRRDLKSQIVYMLHGIDDPRALAFIVTEVGAIRARASAQGSFSPFSDVVIDHWRRAAEDGWPMSEATRSSLLSTWQGQAVDVDERRVAFDIWAHGRGSDDLKLLQEAAADEQLAVRILGQRLARADRSAIPAWIEKLGDHQNGYRWWWHAQHLWGPELTDTLDGALAWRCSYGKLDWGDAIDEDSFTSDALIRLPTREAEHLLLKYWDHLRRLRYFVQAALYVTTPKLRELGHASLDAAPEPGRLLDHLSSGWHMREFGHTGVTRESQILGVEPYLNLLSERDLFALADACNRHGWFSLRQRLFDKRVKHFRISWLQESAHARFDAMLKRKYWIDLEVDEALATGVSWDDYLDAMSSWVAERQSLEALRVMAEALIHRGLRRDLSRLKIYGAMPPAAVEVLIADTTFAVRRRTLN
jgi:hypothetical protein